MLDRWQEYLGIKPLQRLTPDINQTSTQCSVVLILLQDGLEQLQAYQDCKFQNPKDTSAIVVVSPEAS
jgi:hypothetical protein